MSGLTIELKNSLILGVARAVEVSSEAVKGRSAETSEIRG
jgi:hypothetical protein